MNPCIAENIRTLRRSRGMSQEQLAEALGISIAAVSKWEREITLPDLRYLMEMADLFGVSIDALVGYRVQNGAATALEERIHDLQRKKEFAAASAEAEKALIRYPNHFQIVFRCGELYQMKGIETGDREALERAAELLNRAIALLSQNTDPVISETMLRMEIAQCLLALGREEEGLEILKTYNTYGMNDSLIGYTYASSEHFCPDEAVPFLVRAYADCMQVLVRTMCGFANMYSRNGNYDRALEAILWLIRYLESLKTDTSAAAYPDKLLALCYSQCAVLSAKGASGSSIQPYLHKAYEAAVRFDENPTYGVRSLKFCIGDVKNATAFDNTGSTAMLAVETSLRSESGFPELLQYWEELKNEVL